jgi:RNA polymerase sigma-70 factor (ECF subfamily)
MTKSEIVKLASKAQKGDEAAFEELCRAKQREILFTAMTMLGNNADAEDATQETILMMYRSLSQLKNLEAINAWIQTIVRSRCIEILRKRSKYYTDADIDDEAIIISEDNREFIPESYAEDEALSDRLYDIVQSLPAKRREAILLYYYEDLSYKEIAEVTGTSIKTVSTNLMKARKMIKDNLDAGMEPAASNSKAIAIPLAASSTVMGRVLKDQAVRRITDVQMASVEAKWTAQIKAISVTAKAVGHAVAIKAVIATIATVTAFSGVVYTVSHYSGAGHDAPTATVTEGIVSSREVAFVGDDCDCGHINPNGVAISGLEEGDSESAWVLMTKGGSILATGSNAEVMNMMLKLKKDGEAGEYTIICSLSDRYDNYIRMSRDFTIGDYKGDANN